MKKSRNTGNISYCAMLVALAMIFSYVESLIPINFGIPGVKLGIANLVTITGLYYMRTRDVLLIAVMRIMLSGFMFGNGMSILYSLAGGLLSFAVMASVKRTGAFSIAGVSLAGGIAHNVGQLAVAALVVENLRLMYYLPVLMISGTVTGLLIGAVGGKLLSIVKTKGTEVAE